MHEAIVTEIQEFLKPILEEHELAIFELNLKQQDNDVYVDLIIDKVRGGIDLDQCSAVNVALAQHLEDVDHLKNDFIVQVSSPGLDRPLKNAKDFVRVIGREVRLHLNEKIEGKVEHQGSITGVAAETVMVQTKKALVSIPLSVIQKAMQVIK